MCILFENFKEFQNVTVKSNLYDLKELENVNPSKILYIFNNVWIIHLWT